jgi:spermidine synthase
MHQGMHSAGFRDVVLMHFPQCTYPSGWWSVSLARKDAAISDFRASDAARPPFFTRYYSAAIHRAAMALPEFVRRGLSSG